MTQIRKNFHFNYKVFDSHLESKIYDYQLTMTNLQFVSFVLEVGWKRFCII